MSSSTDNTLSAITTSVRPEFDSDLTLQMNRHAPLLTLLPQKEHKATNVTFDVVTSGVTAGSMQQNYTWVVANDMTLDHIQPCTLNWAMEATGLSLGDLQMDALDASQEPSQVTRDHLRTRVGLSVSALLKKINLDFYSGLGTTASPTFGTGTTNTIVGLTPGFADATTNIGGAITSSVASGQTYGGIVRASYPEAAGTYYDNGLASAGSPVTLTTKLMATMVKDVLVKSNLKPSVWVASPGVYVQLEEMVRGAGLTNAYRIMVDNMDPDLGPRVVTVGESAIAIQGIPVIMDYTLGTQETADGYGKLYLLNLNHLEVRYLPAMRASEMTSWSRQEAATTDGGGVLGSNDIKNQLPVKLVRLAKTGDYESFYLKSTLQLVSKFPAANAWMNNIAV